MNQDAKKYSEKAYINHMTILGHTIIVTVLFLAYTLELIKGSRTIGYYTVFSLLAVVPVIAEYVIYQKQPESSFIRHVIGIGYSVLYLFAIFTTHSVTPFVYAFPMFMVIILFMDVRFCILICVGAILGNVAYIAYYAVSIGYHAEEIPDLEIRVAALLLTGIFMVMSTVAVKKVNGEKLKIMEQQAQENATLLENVLGTSNSMVSGIGEVVEKMKHMGESVTHIRESMNQVSAGSTETAESVMAQMLRTEQIQQHIVNVKESTAGIEQNMAETERRVEEGMQQMNALSQQVDISISANKEMLEKMNALREYSNQMNTIIDTINSIAGSTGMLALNASIEAARAGESGKGFAVVASEISNLANQTKMATVDITKLIENIKKELQSVIEAVDVVTDSNHASENNTQVVTDSFDGIAGEAKHIGEQTRELLDIVESLKTANADIVENIRTISAIVEEVSAHANETYNACEENSRLVDSVTEIVQELNDDAQKLQRFSKE